VIEWTVRCSVKCASATLNSELRFRETDVARVIGIAVDEIPSEWPIQPVSTGLTFQLFHSAIARRSQI
jgi:hypothetical protein